MSAKAYRLIERRALLQSIKADERLISELSNLLESCDNAEMKTLLNYLKRNAEERRKALFQIVRDTEKTFGIQKDKVEKPVLSELSLEKA